MVVLSIFLGVCVISILVFCLGRKKKEELPHHQSLDTIERKRQRLLLIRGALLVKPWTEAMSATAAIDETATATTTTIDAELVPKALPTTSKLSNQDSMSSLYGPCCAICLNGFKEGQLVCESKHGSCKHSFHEMCLSEWLLKGHNDCPTCRSQYLVETV
jgi:hypothetical protein